MLAQYGCKKAQITRALDNYVESKQLLCKASWLLKMKDAAGLQQRLLFITARTLRAMLKACMQMLCRNLAKPDYICHGKMTFQRSAIR